MEWLAPHGAASSGFVTLETGVLAVGSVIRVGVGVLKV